MKEIIQVENLNYTYPDGTKALNGVSFIVNEGECIGIVGASGAGKSTLGLCLLGLLKGQSGIIMIDGLEMNQKNWKEIRKRIGLVFQNPDDQLFMPSLFDDVAFGLLQEGINGEELEHRVIDALKERGLEKLAHKFPGRISFGQKRLASLATVLVMEPKILVLDEPSANLDPKARKNLILQLKGLKNTRLILSHDLEMVLELAHRVLVMNDGKIIAEGEPSQILAQKELMEEIGLEVPISLQIGS